MKALKLNKKLMIKNKQKIKNFIFIVLFFSLITKVNAQINSALVGRTTPRIEEIINGMTLEEKLDMLVGSPDGKGFKGIPRLGISDLLCQDGPRGPHVTNSTAFPTCINFGATWNPALISKAATAMALEGKAQNIGVLLGPSLNILRDPLGGRFFEYYTEDPFLNSKITASFVTGFQSQQVAVCLKHYAANNREYNRNSYQSMVDERTLREIYLPAFKAGVDAGALTVMTGANGVNGELASDNKHLLQHILKEDWGFKGFVLTDWCQTRSTEKAAFAGLDVSMPYNINSPFGKPLLNAVKKGKVPIDLINDKVRRILYVFDYVGLLDKKDITKDVEVDAVANRAIAKQIASESIVLLKNSKNILPLNPTKIKKIVVLGPNAKQRFCLKGLGGSSWVEAVDEVTALEGIKKIAPKNVEIKYVSTDDVDGFKLLKASDLAEKDGIKGFKATYQNIGKKGVKRRTEDVVNFVWEMRSPDPELETDNFRAEFIFYIKAKVTGNYMFKITADDYASLRTIGRGGAPMAVADIEKGSSSAIATVQMTAGETYGFQLAYTEKTGDATCRLEWATPNQSEGYAVALKKIDEQVKDADAVIYVGGIDHNMDSEGRDRSDMNFPEMQEKLINHLVKVNPKTIVTLINGSPLKLGGWIKNVPAIVESWYGGVDAGTALAEVLFGKVNPSGRLPFTWVKDLKDMPMYQSTTQNKDTVNYVEGIFVGYRYHETKKVAPQFPFGYGLSYTTFKYEDMQLSKSAFSDKDKLTVTVNITNTGKMDGYEIVQLYIHDKVSSVERPLRELKGFEKVFVEAGKSKSVKFEIDAAALSFYDVNVKDWKAEKGDFEVQVGASSHDIKFKKVFSYQ